MVLHESDLNQVEISHQLKVSRCCFQNAITRHGESGIFEDRKCCGRLKKIDEREMNHRKKLIKGESGTSLSKIASDLSNSLSKPVTSCTVQNYLEELRYEYVTKIKRQRLRVRHRDQKVVRCKNHLHLSADD